MDIRRELEVPGGNLMAEFLRREKALENSYDHAAEPLLF